MNLQIRQHGIAPNAGKIRWQLFTATKQTVRTGGHSGKLISLSHFRRVQRPPGQQKGKSGRRLI
jgi:hypothetical protein